MKTRTARLCIQLIFVLNGSLVFAEAQTTPYIDFEQFTTVIEADNIGFFAKLKLAGMRFASAPAVKRVVPLYEYDTQVIARADCSDEHFRNHSALLIDLRVSTEQVISEMGSDINNLPAEVQQELTRQSWWEEDELRRLSSLHGVSIPDFAPIPVWGEIAFSNSCDLQQIIAESSPGAVTWEAVENPILNTIARAEPPESNGASLSSPRAHVIVTAPFFAASDSTRYLAECAPSSGNSPDDRSLCRDVMTR